jgi:hypothetical protein
MSRNVNYVYCRPEFRIPNAHFQHHRCSKLRPEW